MRNYKINRVLGLKLGDKNLKTIWFKASILGLGPDIEN